MPGMFLRMEINAGDFLRFQRDAIQFASIFEGEDFIRGILEEVGERVMDAVALQFSSEGAYFKDPADPWQSLSDSRQQQRADAGIGADHPILIGETQRLFKSWQWDWLDNHSILIGMYGMGSGPQAMDHYGAWNTFGVSQRGLPPRPMLVVDEQMVKDINKIFEDGFDQHFIHWFGGGENKI